VGARGGDGDRPGEASGTPRYARRAIASRTPIETAETALGAADPLGRPGAGAVAVRGSLLRAGGFVVGLLLTVLSAAVLYRYLGRVDFGRYMVVVSVVALAGGLTEAGLTAVGVREWSLRPPGERETVLANLLGMRAVVTTAAATVAIAFAALAGYGSVLTLGTALGCAGLLLQVWQATVAVPLAADLRLGWVTAAELGRQVLTVVLLVGLAAGDGGLLALLAVPVPVNVAVLVLTLAAAGRSVPWRPRLDLARWRALAADVLPYAAATAVGYAYFRVAIIAMSLVADEDETGLFATSYRVVEMLGAIAALAVTSMFPLLARSARDDEARFTYGVQRLLEASAIAGAFVALCTLAGADAAIAVITGGGAEDAVPVLQVQALGLLVVFVGVASQFALLALRRHLVLLVANAVALTTAVVLAAALAPTFGALGAAVTTVGAEVALACAATAALARAPAGSRLRPGALPRILAPVAPVGAVALLAPVPSVARVALVAVLYVGALLVLRAVPGELLHAVLPRRGVSGAR